MVGAVQSIGSPSAITAEISVPNHPNLGQVSTVDFADTEIGQITTVWALEQLLDGKPSGAVRGSGTQASTRTPAPTPSVTPTPLLRQRLVGTSPTSRRAQVSAANHLGCGRRRNHGSADLLGPARQAARRGR